MALVLCSSARLLAAYAVRRLPPVITATGIRCDHHQTSEEKWQLCSAVCLQRTTKITQEMTKIEKDFSQLMSQLELENSSLSDHELRHKDDQVWAEKRKQEDFEETEADAVRQTAVEAEDAWEDELKAFTPAPRRTEADEANDKRSSERLLDRQLTLVVKQKLGESYQWCLPLGAHKEGESMRQTAERVLKETCGEKISGTFLGNAPVGYLKYKYPPAQQDKEGVVGAKVFFFKAWHKSGNVQPESSNKIISDFQWLTKQEVAEVIPQNYNKCISKFMLEL